MMFLVGLTGGIATGKSMVSKMFQDLGVPVVDADHLARKVVEPGKKAWHQIHKEFGDEVLKDTGELDRETLGNLIFMDAEKRMMLNKITHPEILKEMKWAVIQYFLQGYQFVVLDVPLLFEKGVLLPYLHKIIVVSCEEDLQLQRLMERNKMTEANAKLRIQAQMPLQKKCERAHFIIENSSSLADTRKQVEQVYKVLRSSRAHWKLRIIFSVCFGGLLTLFLWLGTKLAARIK